MAEAFLCEGLRTPIGRYGGALSAVRPDDMLGGVIREVMASAPGLSGENIDDVYMGCANQAGEDNRNVARMASLLAGLPDTVPGVTVNRLCASGLEAVNQAARMIRCDDARLCIAGGLESMSRAPYSMPRGPTAPKAGNVTRVNWNWAANGNCVEVQFDDGTLAKFLHLDELKATAGSRVQPGQVIALSGNTGMSTGPHLHYELHVGGKAVDAMKVKLPNTESIPASEKSSFNAHKDLMMAQLDALGMPADTAAPAVAESE